MAKNVATQLIESTVLCGGSCRRDAKSKVLSVVDANLGNYQIQVDEDLKIVCL